MACNGRFLVSCTLLPQRVRSVCSWDPRHSPMTGTTILLDLGAAQPFPVIKQERLRKHRHRLVESKMALVSTGSVAWKQAQPAEVVQSRRRLLVGKPLAAVVPQSG